MKHRRKLFRFATVFLLVGLTVVPIVTRKSPDLPVAQQQGRDQAPPAIPPFGPDSPEPAVMVSVNLTASGPAAFPAPTDAESPYATSAGVLDPDLTESEQKSLHQAFSEARREVREIPEAWAGREENLGYEFYALHPQQNLTARFGAEAVQIVSSKRSYTEVDAGQPHTAWEARMRLRSFAGREVMGTASPARVSGSRVEYRHAPDLTEWYDNATEAMEHGFTVKARPGHLSANEEVVLEMLLQGLSAAKRESGGRDLVFRDDEREVIAYEKLVVFDATGKELTARMEPTADGFLLAYHDAGATYPVTVDPLIVNEDAKLTASNAATGDEFGFSVSVDGDTLVVGVPLDDDAGNDAGSAYVFIRTGSAWSQQAKLTADDAAANDRFGNSVSVSGDRVIVGSPLDDDDGGDSGSAYVFTRSGSNWSQDAKLTANDAAAGDEFGRSVSIAGDKVVVGASRDDTGAGSVGSAYVFERFIPVLGVPFWYQEEKLTAQDAAVGDRFGNSVSISGFDTVVIGAFQDDDAGNASGSAYVFFDRQLQGWEEQAKLTAHDAAAGDEFGRSVSVSGDTVVVGARFDGSAGSAYVFTRNGSSWNQQAKLTADDAAAGDEFGNAVSVSGDTVVVGANRKDSQSGGAYVFTRSGSSWSQQMKLTADDAAAGDEFGRSVSVSGDTVVVGAPFDEGEGSAHVYRLLEVPTLMVLDHLGNLLRSGEAAAVFSVQRIATSQDYSFTLRNAGESDLDLQTISLTGADAGQFSLVVPDLSSMIDLEPDASMPVTVTFQPTGGSGVRRAILVISSDDAETPIHSVILTGPTLSDSEDGDGDGMNDWAEYDLRGFGFDWQNPQNSLVAEFYQRVPSAGLVTLDEVAGLRARSRLLEVNPSANRAKFTIGLQQSGDLITPFAPIIADPSRLSVDAEGRIVYEVDAPPGTIFYLMEVSP